MGAICKVCGGDMLKVDGCLPTLVVYEGKQYEQVKVGGMGDFYEGDNENTRCTDCGAKYGYYHHSGCDCKRCPVCGGQCLSCGCRVKTIKK